MSKLRARAFGSLLFLSFFLGTSNSFGTNSQTDDDQLKIYTLPQSTEGQRTPYLLRWNKSSDEIYSRIDISLNSDFRKHQSFYTDKAQFLSAVSKGKTFYFRKVPFGAHDEIIDPVSSDVSTTDAIDGDEGLEISESFELNEKLHPPINLNFYPSLPVVETTTSGSVSQVLKFDEFEAKRNLYLEIQISTNEDFREPKFFYSHKPFLETKLFPERTYFFRFLVKDPNGKTKSKLSKVTTRRLRIEQKESPEEELPPSPSLAAPEIPPYQEPRSQDVAPLPPSSTHLRKFYVGAGLGLTHNTGTQNTDDLADIKYESFMGPAVFLELGYRWNSNWRVKTLFHHRLGRINNELNDQGQVNYNLQNYFVALQYDPEWLQLGWANISLTGGASLTEVPVVSVVDYANSIVNVLNADYTNFFAEITFTKMISENWQGQFSPGLHIPILRPKLENYYFQSAFQFQWRAGLVRTMDDFWNLGLFLQGQLQQLEYEVTDVTTHQGTQKSQQNSLELRMGFSF